MIFFELHEKIKEEKNKNFKKFNYKLIAYQVKYEVNIYIYE